MLVSTRLPADQYCPRCRRPGHPDHDVGDVTIFECGNSKCGYASQWKAKRFDARSKHDYAYLYVVEAGDGSLYCGWTNDLTRRLVKHRDGTGAKYLRGRGPIELLVSWSFSGPDAETTARRLEVQFKALPRAKKIETLRSAPEVCDIMGASYFQCEYNMARIKRL